MPYVYMLVGSVAFALMGTFAHRAADSFPWAAVAFTRSVIVCILVAGLAVQYRVPLIVIGPRMLWVRSIAGSVSMLCTFYALTHMQVSNALTLTNTFPLWVALLAWPLFGVRPTLGILAALTVAILGVALIENPGEQGWSYAALVALAASLATAVAMLGLNRLGNLHPKAIVVHFAAVSLPFTAVAGWIGGDPLSLAEADMEGWCALLATGITAAVGQYFLTLAFSSGDAARVSVVGLSQVVFALGIDIFWWNHPADRMKMLGVACILLPTAWVMTRRKRASAAADAMRN